MAEGTKAYEEGRHAEAERWLRAALKEAQGFASQKMNLVRSLENLAEHYRAEGRYAEAEPLYKHSLAILETVKGSEDPDVAGSLNNLAGFYAAQGRFTEAEPLYKRSLRIWQKILGQDHPFVATRMEKYAALLRRVNRETEAGEIEARVNAIRAKDSQANPTW